MAKFPYSPKLHRACGSMYVVLCMLPQLLYCFYHYFPSTAACIMKYEVVRKFSGKNNHGFSPVKEPVKKNSIDVQLTNVLFCLILLVFHVR